MISTPATTVSQITAHLHLLLSQLLAHSSLVGPLPPPCLQPHVQGLAALARPLIQGFSSLKVGLRLAQLCQLGCLNCCGSGLLSACVDVRYMNINILLILDVNVWNEDLLEPG